MSKTLNTRPTVEDEDLDDLDDVLDQFSQPASKPVATPSQPPPPSSSSLSKAPTTSAPQTTTAPEQFNESELSTEFARELAEGMASLMREITGEVKEGGANDPESEEDKKNAEAEALRKAWEAMLIEGMDGLDLKGVGSEGKETGGSAGSSGKGPSKESFQDSIRKTMEKMKESDSTLQAESATSSTDPLEALLAQLSGGDGSTENEIGGLLETMMSSLMSKEVLYEPLKELGQQFPGYLKDNAATLTPNERDRYEKQQECVSEIVKIFESPNYSDKNDEQQLRILELMNKMQTYGSPPKEIMGELPPGLNLGEDGLPDMGECTIS